MFQTFETPAQRKPSAERVKELRRLMVKSGLNAYLVPRADEHQGEYVPACAERLKWLSGFSGSAGLAIVTRKAAALFVDGRYTVQARAEADAHVFEVSSLPRGRISEWLGENLFRNQTIGFDPKHHTVSEIIRLQAALKVKGIALKPVARNLIDRVWGRGRSPPPANPVSVHPLKFAGRSAQDKIAAVQGRLKASGHDAVVLTLTDSVAWAFNIRGSDIAHTPVPLAFAIIPRSGRPELFIAPEKLDGAARAHLVFARVSPPNSLAGRLKALRKSNKRVRLDPNTASWWFASMLGGVRHIAAGADPCLALKAVKNAAEIKGAGAAHLRDGAAVTRFLAWLDREAPSGEIDEISATRQLESYRRATDQLREISFDTIAGSGPNAAIVHYRVNEETNRKLRSGELFLIDSGAQYLDGTTDITRTVAIGKPTKEMCVRFTLVLQGHIAIATARFPKGTRGVDLDPLARRALWTHGLDYDHGTGHGVGSYLSVHEGPQSISRAGMAVLEPGMICSIEPGYYKEGTYGIRIENLVLVSEPQPVPGGDREMMGFETLTLAPIDQRLIVRDMLSTPEITWLNGYHARVAKMLGPGLDAETRKWLKAATAPI